MNLAPNNALRSQISEFMTTTIKKILKFLPKVMHKDHFGLAEELLNHADEFNRSLKYEYSALIIETLVKVLPKLIKEKHGELVELTYTKIEACGGDGSEEGTPVTDQIVKVLTELENKQDASMIAKAVGDYYSKREKFA